MSGDGPRAWRLRSAAGPGPRLGGEDFDLRLADAERLARLAVRGTGAVVLDAPVRFDAPRMALVDGTDLPANPSGWPVLSRRALDALLAVAPFAHRWWPAAIHDRAGAAPVRAYGVVQLLTAVDALDLARSTFQALPGAPTVPLFVRAGVLRDDVPLPPLFRLANYPTPLLVSVDGRRALEAVPVLGVAFHDPADGL